MTIAAIPVKEIKPGNGSTTTFTFGFKIRASDQLVVVKTDANENDTVLVEGTGTANYSLSVARYPGSGSITYPASGSTKLATGERLTLYQLVNLGQPTDLQNQGAYAPDTVESMFDLGRMIDAQQQEEIDASFKFKRTVNDPGSVELKKTVTERRGKTLVFTDDVNADLDVGTSFGGTAATGVTETSSDTNKTKLVNDLLMNIALGKKGADWASATTIDLATYDGDYVNVTGTTTITGFSNGVSGREYTLVFNAACQLTHGAGFILPGNANITTAAGDILTMRMESSNVARVVNFQRDAESVDILHNLCEGRLTAATGAPYETTDRATIDTIYFTPFRGNRIAIYDGTNWKEYRFSEISVATSTGTASKPNDIFIYDNSGTLTLELTAWTNDTTRATALTTQDGVYVKSGATSRRYLGTCYLDSTPEVSDTLLHRGLWNYYNRMPKALKATDGTDTWNYTTATFRPANNDTSNAITFVRGLAEGFVKATVLAQARNTSAGVDFYPGIGLNSTSVDSATFHTRGMTFVAGNWVTAWAIYLADPGIGKHTLTWLESSVATGTTTWGGDDGGNMQCGIFSTIMC